MTIAREINDRRGEGAHLGNLGLAYSNLGEVRRAIEYYEQALTIAREINDRRGEGNRLGNLGSAYSQMRQELDMLVCSLVSLVILYDIESPNVSVGC